MQESQFGPELNFITTGLKDKKVSTKPSLLIDSSTKSIKTMPENTLKKEEDVTMEKI